MQRLLRFVLFLFLFCLVRLMCVLFRVVHSWLPDERREQKQLPLSSSGSREKAPRQPFQQCEGDNKRRRVQWVGEGNRIQAAGRAKARRHDDKDAALPSLVESETQKERIATGVKMKKTHVGTATRETRYSYTQNTNHRASCPAGKTEV